MDLFGGKRLELEILKPFIKSKTETSAGLMLELEWGRSFERLIMSSRRMSLSFDTIQKYVATHNMVRKSEMDETWRSCSTRLLGTGVALESKGTLFPRQAFGVSPTVKKIREFVPEVIEDDSLAQSLNEDPVLMKLVSESKPGVFTVDLSVSFEGLQPGVELRSLLTQPREITWTAEIESYVTRSRGVSKAITSIVDMMDIAITKAVENSKRLKDAAP